MNDSTLSVVTGAFGHTGRYIVRKPLSAGRETETLQAQALKA